MTGQIKRRILMTVNGCVDISFLSEVDLGQFKLVLIEKQLRGSKKPHCWLLGGIGRRAGFKIQLG